MLDSGVRILTYSERVDDAAKNSIAAAMNGKGFSSDGGRRRDFHPEETYKSLITISVEALKLVALINGGAAVAILVYLGNLASRSGDTHPPNMAWALICFATGLF